MVKPRPTCNKWNKISKINYIPFLRNKWINKVRKPKLNKKRTKCNKIKKFKARSKKYLK